MDTFEHRLQQFLDMENISQAQFATTLGIQRGGLSHLLSGRNKPSYDFIVKLISSYPLLNSEWLLTGRGKPYKNAEPALELFSCTTAEPAQEAENLQLTQETPPSQPSEDTIFAARTVERVVIFYSDGTFEER